MVGRPKKDSNNLSVDRIVDAAWKVVDREGVSALSTRALAAELGVQSPALYWHVKNKQKLLGLMVEYVLGDPIRELEDGMNWSEWLRAVVMAQRRALLSHRDSGRILSMSSPSERLRTDVFPQIIKPLIRGGLSRELAQVAGGIMASYLLGWIIYEQNEDTRDMMASYHDPEAAFEDGLDAILIGIEVKARNAETTTET